jgi:ubiquinone/menaquinone biosynthesis C-methylase UbiE
MFSVGILAPPSAPRPIGVCANVAFLGSGATDFRGVAGASIEPSRRRERKGCALQCAVPRETLEYFTGLAGVYDANRPSYPIDAIDAVLAGLPRPTVIADVGCGTGISTRLLAIRAGSDGRVIGIDPNTDMLREARLAAHRGGLSIDFREGTGEQTGLDDQSVDAVVCAQAFHWLKPREALREFHRVLKRMGRLALLWNVRDDDHDAFTAAYSQIARRAMDDAASRGLEVHDLRSADPTVGGYFTNARLRKFGNPHRLTLEGLLGRARSASYFPRVDPLRGEMEGELRELFTRYQENGAVLLWHRTEVTLADSVTGAR